MARIIQIFVLLALTAVLALQAEETPMLLEENCLACHREQKLPDNLIYRRYLLKYSSPTRIESALMVYLKSPSKPHSIMPREFFLRFPMKYPTELDEATLQRSIRAYMDYFDVKRRLRLEE
jgi:hypothetical protein